jgi:hypothetical protein
MVCAVYGSVVSLVKHRVKETFCVWNGTWAKMCWWKLAEIILTVRGPIWTAGRELQASGRRFIYLLSHSVEQNISWEAYSLLARPEIHHLLWNAKFRYLVCMVPPLGFIVDHTHPIYTLTPYLFMIHRNIILSSVPRSSKLSLLFTFFNENFLCCRTTCICHT